MLVHRLESVTQQLTRFAIDFANRILQCGDGFVQIGRLGVQKGFALSRRTQFFQGGQIDSTQSLNITLEVIDF